MKQFLLTTPLVVLTTIVFGQFQIKKENLKILWPDEYNWKIGLEQQDKATNFVEIVPGNESIEKWTTLGALLTLKNTQVETTDQVVEMFKRSSLKESSKSKLTIIEKNDTSKNFWVLFKIETSSVPNSPDPESQLYYAIRGEQALYVTFVAIKKKTLENDFLTRWSAVFKTSELIFQ